MIVGGLAEVFFGVSAERQALEDVATPLSLNDPSNKRVPARSGFAPATTSQKTTSHKKRDQSHDGGSSSKVGSAAD